jgi:outer membrane receptor protein involved in Fe transport
MDVLPKSFEAFRFNVAVPGVTLIATLLLAPPAALATAEASALVDMPLEQLLNMEVYSASKFIQSLSEAPSVASVITADDIRTFGWRTLAEALASVRGLYVTSDRNYDYLGARGFLRPGDYNSRFLLLIDGYRVNDAVYDQAPIGSDFPLDLELVDRIEYVPGAGSSVYGSNAFFGVINVISKPGRSLMGSRAGIDIGSFGERRARASYGWESAGGQRFVLSASDSRVRGQDLHYPEFERPGASDGIARNLDYDRAKKAMFKGEAGDLTLTALYASRDKGIPTASFGQVFNDPRSHTFDTQSALKLDYQTALDQHTNLSLRAFLGRHDYVGSYAYDAAPLGMNVDGSRARWWGSEAKLVSTAIAGHKLVAGVEYQRDYHTEQTNYVLQPGVVNLVNLDDSRQRHRAAGYLQDEWTLRDDLLLSAGLRYDMLTAVKSSVSPRLALIWKASEATTVKAIGGTSFRAPNVYELYYAVPGEGGQVANPGLKPEHIRSFELALEHRYSAENRFTASLFRNSVKDLISQQAGADGMLMFRNLDQVTAQGVELEAEKIWAGNMRLRSSYTWQRSRDGRTGQEPPNSPHHLGKLNLSYRFGAWTRLGLEAQYTSSRATLSARTGSYWLANATLVHTLSPSAELSASAYNLFNARYADPGSGEHVQDTIARNGRTLRATLNLRF